MELPTDIDVLIDVLMNDGWQPETPVDADAARLHRLRHPSGFVFEARKERKVWRGRLDRGDGWRWLEHVVHAAGTTSSDRFDLTDLRAAGAALAYQGQPQHPYVRWETVVPRCIDWLRTAPPAPTEPIGDLVGSLARRDFHQACLDIIDRRTHGLHLRPMPPAPRRARTSPIELLHWLRRNDIHERVRWSRGFPLRESGNPDRPTAIGGESQMLWVAYLDAPQNDPDPEVAIYCHLHHDFVRGELLATLPLSNFILGCLIATSDFHSSWGPVPASAHVEPLWSEATKLMTMTVGANWVRLDGQLLVDEPAPPTEVVGDEAQARTIYDWGTRTV